MRENPPACTDAQLSTLHETDKQPEADMHLQDHPGKSDSGCSRHSYHTDECPRCLQPPLQDNWERNSAAKFRCYLPARSEAWQ